MRRDEGLPGNRAIGWSTPAFSWSKYPCPRFIPIPMLDGDMSSDIRIAKQRARHGSKREREGGREGGREREREEA
eukprot:754808-Hanusia_phi.AAC.1